MGGGLDITGGSANAEKHLPIQSVGEKTNRTSLSGMWATVRLGATQQTVKAVWSIFSKSGE